MTHGIDEVPRICSVHSKQPHFSFLTVRTQVVQILPRIKMYRTSFELQLVNQHFLGKSSYRKLNICCSFFHFLGTCVYMCLCVSVSVCVWRTFGEAVHFLPCVAALSAISV